MKEKECECGCGTKMLPLDKRGRSRRFLIGHVSRAKDANWKTNKEFLKRVGDNNGDLTRYRESHNNFKGKDNPFFNKTHSVKSVQNILHGVKMTQHDKWFEELVERNALPYKWVGDGQFMIGRFNPDFVNVNGCKLAVEIFEGNRSGTYEKKRTKQLGVYGWNVVFFRIKNKYPSDKEVISKLKEFGW